MGGRYRPLLEAPLSERLRFATTTETRPAPAVEALARALASADPVLVLFFHDAKMSAEAVAAAAHRALPGVRTAGCSTLNELWGGAFHAGTTVAVAFCAPARASVEVVADMQSFRFAHGAALAGRLAAGLDLPAAGVRGDRHLLLTLTDGLTGGDERLLRSLHEALPGVPLVGGNAGDGTRFEETWTWADGEARTGGGVVMLVEPAMPFRAFATHHYSPTGQRVVVTRSDPERRRITELNGWPALVEYGRLRGAAVVPGESLGGESLQFGIRADEGYHLRALMAAREEGLVSAGAVAEGEILHVMRPGDLVDSTAVALADVLGSLPDEGQRLLLFHCGGRYLAARDAGTAERLARVMAPVPAAGFSTYGEHCGAQLVNLTLTGVAFAHAGPADAPGFALVEESEEDAAEVADG